MTKAYHVFYIHWSKGFTTLLTKSSKYFFDENKAEKHKVQLQKQLDQDLRSYEPEVKIEEIGIE